MSMSDSSFEFILEALRMQKQHLEELQAENSELRHQLAALRNGHGISVDILGTRFALVAAQSADIQKGQELAKGQDASTMEIAQAMPAPLMPGLPETPRPLEPVDEHIALADQTTAVIPPAFLEDAFEDEDDFLNSATRAMAVWPGPETNPRQKSVEEEEKAALRRQLIGSFLLE